MENKVASPPSDTIYHDFKRKLTWNDFQGVPDMNHKGEAVTSSGFAFKWNAEDNGETVFINISVYCYFSKSNSWKKKMAHSDYHLRHEQHHFDITRLGAEKLVNEFKNASYTAENYKALISQVFDRVYDENLALQNEYDRQTKHSIDKEKQMEWNDLIGSKLMKLK
ncbi:MAG: DUF922 domain-containing protein [Ginsengibacter sp.]